MSTAITESAVPDEDRPGPSHRPLVLFSGSEPIRAELYSVEHLEAHARQLARDARLAVGKVAGQPLLRRFYQNGRALERAHRRILAATERRQVITPDAEWLLDNFHIIADNLREVRQDLPRGYYRELPKLAGGPFAGLPRVYALGIELIAHTDSGLGEDAITRFVLAYQSVVPLTMGELWAVPIVLRLGLLENLRRLAGQMLQTWDERHKARALADRLAGVTGGGLPPTHPRPVVPVSSSDPLLVCLLETLRERGPDASEAVGWLEEELAARGTSSSEVFRREHQRQAANQVSVGNCVTSLRLLSSLDWTVFFEHTSLVEALLQDDPAGVHGRQDFATKDRCRHAVEQLARGSDRDELEVARRALELARQASGPVGQYLIGTGRQHLEAELSFRPALGERLRRAILNHPDAFYFGFLGVVLAPLLVAFLVHARREGATASLLVLVLAAVLLPVSDLAVGLVHYLITLLLPPRVLPKFDFKDGIPADGATFVVMPTLLLHRESAVSLAERLEVHYLSNPDPNLYFALLTDFADSPTEHQSEDDEYVRVALERIEALNQRYGAEGADRFFLFHRKRVWNAAQGCWMGWERKRGKLSEFNRLLRGARDTTYTVVSAEPGNLPSVRYVITLDADTQMPREAAGRLIGTLHHPLNRPRFDPARGRVVEGYGVLQPRVGLSLVAATRSLFSRILAWSAGIDPYTTAVSDVYQDLFGRGTFTGKGIYDVDAFEAAVGHTFPENQILSHDLIEGNYARCGLVTDIELLDDFPARYHAYARREHRWIRGDWQILPWLFRTVPAPGGWRRNPLPVLERWKVFDNLRRSLVPPALIVLFALGWTVLPGSPWFWTALGLAALGLPLILLLLNSLLGLLRGGSWLLHLREMKASLPSTAGQVLLRAAFLADQSWQALDAIVRTLARLFVTRRNLLEWETAATTERRLGAGFLHFGATMWAAPALATVLGLAVLCFQPGALPAASPLLAAWLASPLLAYWVSRPRAEAEPPLTADERRQLRRTARKTWRFFETFVTEGDHWLPPDNYQEDPKGRAAHRTSPTNMGLYLLSSLAAHDLGYLSLTALADRLEKTLATFDRLERFHGHFHNWYDTLSLKVMPPGYLSTVDSGNLLGCLVTLGQGLREKTNAALGGPAVREGLADTLGLAVEALDAVIPAESTTPGAHHVLRETIEELGRIVREAPADLAGWAHWLERIERRADELVRQGLDLAGEVGATPEDLQRWLVAFADQVRDHRQELNQLAPWVERLSELGRRLSARPVEKRSRNSPPDPLLQRWQTLQRGLRVPVALSELQALADPALAELAALEELAGTGPAQGNETAVGVLTRRLHRLAERAGTLAREMDFKLLYDQQRHLFAIGYNHALGRLDPAHYDLLASESCLTSFLAVARGDAPRKHWFQLGRQLRRTAGGIGLVSWGGTMFEYLMPRLLLRCHAGTLLEVSWRAAVDCQIEYGRQNRVPWGISESGFNALDAALDYQYQSFGVPALGLKRGLARDLVIAPYATGLAVVIRPHAAAENFRALAAERAEGAYGFYEAIDYTRDRLLEKRRSAVVRSYMAHHQGMLLVALTNCLLGDPMPRRFHREPMVRATELLLQERVPGAAPTVEPPADETADAAVVRENLPPMSRRLTTPDTPYPRTHLLSNGQYSVMVTNAGAGSSTCSGLAVTRWREDRTCDAWGQFFYLRDVRTGLVWSAGHQPVGRPADRYEVVYSADKAEFFRSDERIDTLLEVCVSPENCAEVRRVTLTNHHFRTREIEVTSYLEIALLPHRADLAHPAFGKLFLETEFFGPEDALLCRRRPRAADQRPVWAVHVMALDSHAASELEYETDRARFLGRGRTATRPAALDPGAVLSGTTGPVLDPIFSLRRRVRVASGASVSVAFSTAVAQTREEALALADQYHDLHGVNRAFELAWAHTQVQLRHLNLSTEEAHLFQRLAAHVLYAGPTLRAVQSVLAANRQGQPGLWKHGISGDRPIVLVRIAEPEELGLVRQLLLAHAYWRLQGLEVDLVLLNEHPAGYLEELHQQMQGLVRSSDSHLLIDKPGGVFLRRVGHLTEDDQVLLQSAARVVLAGNRGSLAAQVDRRERPVSLPARREDKETRRQGDKETRRQGEREGVEGGGPPAALLFANGHGGFDADGTEYVINVRPWSEPAPRKGPATRSPGHLLASPSALPPAPWSNVIANPSFGFLVSESGGGYTWAGNSQMNRLTPWSNDPVSDAPGEAVFLRDDATGEHWTPTPLPRGVASCTVRHGQGCTAFETESRGLRQELLLFVPPDDPVKLLRLRVRNLGPQPRRLSAVFYAEWVLGTVRDQAPMQVITEFDVETQSLLARNPFHTDFAGQVAFAATTLRAAAFTADRTEFLGRNRSVAAPAALERVGLAGSVGPGLDPCAAFMGSFPLQPGEEREIVFFLGSAPSLEEVRRLLRRYRQPGQVQEALAQAKGRWDRVLGAVQVRTPDPALDLLLNRWLVYQVLSCRVWGRSAFYQSGGAYGFRDQLQDVMALVYGAPREARAHLLRAASRQFLEGDVQHWWHPPAGRGVRTRFSDDFLWLPLVVHHYVTTTGDAAVLDEPVSFLRGPLLRPEQEEDYGLPEVTDERASLYEHCVRAIENGFRYGPHGLPLMGTGDWNDGMNKVGAGGRGESVWNAWFQITILRRFAELADRRGDNRATPFREQAERLRIAVEEHAWDGAWYRRAYFDDGTPLGSAQNDECRIDSLAQTWGVISGAADPERARQAMAAVDEHLVRWDDRLILLFTPPFDRGKLEPGYIKGYVPGIRENGGQYTHAATWVVEAAALLGRGSRAVELFDLLNPIRHAASPEDVARYKVEPYVVAADVYGAPPHTGRGGWTWYTGSAGWLYRVGLEAILGFRLRGDGLRLDPCIPARWPGFDITYRHRSATYRINVVNPQGVERGVQSVTVDGNVCADGLIPLSDDGREHEVRVVLG